MEFSVGLDLIFDKFTEGVVIVHQSKIIAANDSSVRYVRAKSKDDVIGKSIYDFVHKDSLSDVKSSLQYLEQSGESISKAIIKINCLDGLTRRFEFSGLKTLYKGQDCFIIISREVEHYFNLIDELKEKEEKLDAVFRVLPDMFFIVNSNRIIVDYHAHSGVELYKPTSEFMGKSIYESLPDYLAKLADRALKRVLTTGLSEEFEYSLEANERRDYYLAKVVKKSEDEVLFAITNVTKIKQTEISLDNELKFNSIITSLSLKFINCTQEELDITLNKVLEEIGNYFKVDRVYIFSFDYGNGTMSNTHEWCAENISSQIDNLQNIPLGSFPDFVSYLMNGKFFNVENVDMIEDVNLRDILKAQQILSFLVYPIFINNSCYGFVGLDSVRAYKKFTEREHKLLNLLSNFLASIFQRIKTERELKEKDVEISEARISMLNLISDLQDEIQLKEKVEQDLRLSEEKFRSYIEQSSSIIYTINRSGKLTYVSPASEQVLGEEAKNLIGKYFAFNVHKDDIKYVLEQLKYLIKTKKSIHSVPIRMRHKNGHYIWIVVSAAPILDDNGEIKEILGVAVDVNELVETRELLKKTELRYRDLFENQIEAYALHEIILDNDGKPCDYRFIDVNKAFLEMTGLTSKSEILGKTLLEVWPNIEREWIQIYGDIALNGGKITFEKFASALNKTYLVNAYSQEKFKFAVSFFDITDRKISEVINKIQLRIATAIIQSEDLKQLVTTIKSELSQLVDTTNFFVAKYDESSGQFTTIIFSDEKDEFEEKLSEIGTLSSIVVRKKTPLLLTKSEIMEIDKQFGNLPSDYNPEVWLGVPILIKTKSIGIIVIQNYNNPRAYNQSTIDLFQTIASQLAVFIEQQQFESQVRLLSQAIEQSSMMVLMTDNNGIIQFANQKFFEVTKYTKNEIYGQHPRILKSGYHSREFYKNMWSYLAEGKTWSGEILNRDKLGNNYWVSAVISPVIGKNGKVTNYIGIQEDITEKKKLQSKIETSERQLRATWENSIDGMRLTDENGIILDVNQALCDMYGVTREKLIGKPYYVYLKSYSKGRLKTFSENVKSGKVEKIKEYTLELENGKTINVELTNSIIKFDDGKNYLFSIFRDITEKKKMINELILAKEKAEEMNRIKSQFFANMSHELRTPFMGILGFTELLRDMVESPEALTFIDGIERSSRRMVETLTNILDLSKFESGKLETKKELIDIQMIILETCEHFKYQALKKKIAFDCNVELPNNFKFLSNAKLFRSILNNLLSNAVKFTNEGKVEVNSFLTNGHLVIEVVDTGIGIPKDKQEIIFDEFRQVSEGHARAFEGTGLGLSIVKKFVELLGGTVSLESELDKGSKFTVKFPL
jgi:PAS domain S-box-containing protein